MAFVLYFLSTEVSMSYLSKVISKTGKKKRGEHLGGSIVKPLGRDTTDTNSTSDNPALGHAPEEVPIMSSFENQWGLILGQ